MGTTRPRLHELWLVLFVALFSVLSSAHVVVGKAGKGRNDRVLTRIRTMCETRVDSWGPVCTVDQTAKDNCVLRCISEDCYKAIYGADPLEDGEIDNRRGPQFRDCASRDLRKPSRAADLEAAQIGF